MRFNVRLVGARAVNAMHTGAGGRVVAVFSNTFYANLGQALVCIGGNALTAGPLNVISQAPTGVDWGENGLLVGDRVRTSPGHLHVAAGLIFSWADAEIWTPPDPPADWSLHTLREGLDELTRLAAGRIPDQGLGYTILSDKPDASTIVSDFAFNPIRHFRDWIRRSLVGRNSDPPETLRPETLCKIVPLLGLGPGLTPSGDDFLGGAMIVLHYLAQRAVVHPIASMIRQFAECATTPISVAHLAAAAEGQGSMQLHEALNGIVGGKQEINDDLLSALDRIGHCSGWDALAGAVMVLRIWLEIEEAAEKRSVHGANKGMTLRRSIENGCGAGARRQSRGASPV